jgi:hypothetical protein
MGMRAWDNILSVLPDIEIIQQAWTYHWKSYFDMIDHANLRSKDTFAVFKSKYHPLAIPVVEA